jgi:hypothetical protein
VKLPAEVTNQVREAEGGGEEGAVGCDEGSAQRRVGRHRCARPEGQKAIEGY